MAKSAALKSGNRWESAALEHLAARGLDVVERNFHCRHGEIDLIMRHRDCLVFVEVRYRRASSFASAAGSVDRAKQRKLSRTAGAFLARHRRFGDCDVRFDVVAFDESENGQCRLQWLQDAFRPET